MECNVSARHSSWRESGAGRPDVSTQDALEQLSQGTVGRPVRLATHDPLAVGTRAFGSGLDIAQVSGRSVELAAQGLTTWRACIVVTARQAGPGRTLGNVRDGPHNSPYERFSAAGSCPLSESR